MIPLFAFDTQPTDTWDLADLVDAYRLELPSVTDRWLESHGGIQGLEDLLIDAGHAIREVSAVTIDIARWDGFCPITYAPIVCPVPVS